MLLQRRQLAALAAGAALVAALQRPLFAGDNYPSRPARRAVGDAPGGVSDILAEAGRTEIVGTARPAERRY